MISSRAVAANPYNSEDLFLTSRPRRKSMAFSLPELPYSYDALAPYMGGMKKIEKGE